MPLVLGDLTPENAVQRTRNGDGPSIAWILGHLLCFRCMLLNLLGKQTDNPYKSAFLDSGATDGAGYPSLDDMRAQWNTLHHELESVMESVTDEALNQPGPAGPHGEQTLLQSLIFYPWHESYHMGALGAVRKELGLPATADLGSGGQATGRRRLGIPIPHTHSNRDGKRTQNPFGNEGPAKHSDFCLLTPASRAARGEATSSSRTVRRRR